MGYDRKIIETPTTIEIWEYELPIDNGYRLEQLDKIEKRKFEELTAPEQLVSLERKKRYYLDKRWEIARLVDTNFNENTSFLTLSYRENIQDIDKSNAYFEKFIKRLNYKIYKTKKARLKYIATPERQKRGAIHYHIIMFDVPYIPFTELLALWGVENGVRINKIDVDSKDNRGRYVSKYFAKDLDLKDHKSKAYFTSRNLVHPKEILDWKEREIGLDENALVFEKVYPRLTKRNGEYIEGHVKYKKYIK